jgi:hypothetical protein
MLSVYCKASFTDSTLNYPIVVKFQSICCGVPSASPLEKMISTFKRKQHLKKISAYKIGPLGREGEYVLAFPLLEMSIKKRQKFIGKVKTIVPKMKDKGNAEFEINYSTNTSSLPSSVNIEKIFY